MTRELESSARPNVFAPDARYYALSAYMRREFGGVVRKISVDAHFSCPNIDGSVGRGGCIFCDAASFSPSRQIGLREISDQIEDGVTRLKRRFDASKFIAYFQPSTNTHAPVDVLERVYRSALRRPEIVGIAIGTRPDACSEPVLALLETLARETWLALELGVQSSHDRTLQWLNRGHDYRSFVDATRRARARGLRVGAHVILGLPCESRADVATTARRLATLGLHSIKLHHLYVVKGTRLERLWRDGAVPLPTLDEYAELVVDFLERLSPSTVVERVAGEVGSDYLVAPSWTAIKHAGRNAVERALRARDSYQCKYFDPSVQDPFVE